MARVDSEFSPGSNAISRRRFTALLVSAPLAVAAGLALGCTTEKERVSESYSVNLKDTPLIPVNFTDKSVTEIVVEEIVPRLRVKVPFNSSTLPDVSTHIDTQNETLDLTYRYRYGFGGPEESVAMTVTTRDGKNRYALGFGYNDYTRVVDGETATQKEADEIRDRMRQTLLTSFNESIKQGKQVPVAYYYYREVPKTPTVVPTATR